MKIPSLKKARQRGFLLWLILAIVVVIVIIALIVIAVLNAISHILEKGMIDPFDNGGINVTVNQAGSLNGVMPMAVEPVSTTFTLSICAELIPNPDVWTNEIWRTNWTGNINDLSNVLSSVTMTYLTNIDFSNFTNGVMPDRRFYRVMVTGQ